MKSIPFGLLLLVGALVLLASLVIQNRGYYELDAAARPQHEAHAVLRSSGDVGLTCAFVGSALLLLNLTYLLRKRFARGRWIGNLRAWMGLHVMTGILGAALILVHSAFLMRSAPGVLAISCLGIVVVAGLVGRYFFSLVPRSLAGRELERADLRRRFEEHRAELAARGVALPAMGKEPADELSGGGSFLSRLLGVFAGDRQMRGEYRALKSRILGDAALRAEAQDVLGVARAYCRDGQWLRRYSDLRGLMGSWRFLHRWLAVVMVIIAAFHVALAISFGDLRMPSRWLP